MAIQRVGNATQFIWGLPDGKKVAIAGRNVSVNRRKTSEIAELPTEEGETDGAVFYNGQGEVTIEAIMPSNFSAQAPSSTLTFDDKTYYISECSEAWSNKDWAKVNISARTWDAMA